MARVFGDVFGEVYGDVFGAADAAPEVTWVSPPDGSRLVVGRSYTFVATAEDGEDGPVTIDTYIFDFGGPRQQNLGPSGVLIPEAADVGPRSVTAFASDSAENQSSASRDFTVVGRRAIVVG